MLEWVCYVVEEVQKEANADPEYQELARRRADLDSAFTDLLERLSEDDRELSVSKIHCRGGAVDPPADFAEAKSVAARRKRGYFPKGNPKIVVFRWAIRESPLRVL